jgi:integrase/recombinase XerD
MVRGFTRYWKQRDPRTQVPPTSILPAKAQRRIPVLLEDDEVQQLMLAAASLRTISPLWRSTVTMIVGLLAVTGMRIGEVVSLDDDDVDWDEGVLKVKRAKFGKSRLVPLHRSTTAALRRYVDERGHTASTSAMFWSPTGGRASVSHVRASFNALLRLTNLPRPATARRPTLHDFRHRFAIKTLVNWYRSGADVGQTMPALCTYLGHVNINSTYWYLSAAPELLGVACDRLERQLARSP